MKRCNSLSESGARSTTPLPVPIQSRLHDAIREVMRTNVKPSLLTPTKGHSIGNVKELGFGSMTINADSELHSKEALMMIVFGNDASKVQQYR